MRSLIVKDKSPTDLHRFAQQLLDNAAEAANKGADALRQNHQLEAASNRPLSERDLADLHRERRRLAREVDYQEGVQHALTATLGELLEIPHDQAADLVLERVIELESADA
jgi:hypothetical protein